MDLKISDNSLSSAHIRQPWFYSFIIWMYVWLSHDFKLIHKLDNHYSLRLVVLLGYYADDLSPNKCTGCGSEFFKEVATDTINGYYSETVVTCTNCEIVVANWLYGNYLTPFQ